MEIQLRDAQGQDVGTIQVRDDVFGVPSNPALVHQVMEGQRANTRPGTASTKTRSQVSASGKKVRPQKHTGFARAGAVSAPQWRGGGRAFGPSPRSFRQRTPKKMRRLSMLCLLSDKVREGALAVVDELTLDGPKTRDAARALEALGAGPTTLLMADGADSLVLRSARNIPRLKMLPASLLNTLDLYRHRKVIMTLEAVRKAESLWGRDPRRGATRPDVAEARG